MGVETVQGDIFLVIALVFSGLSVVLAGLSVYLSRKAMRMR